MPKSNKIQLPGTIKHLSAECDKSFRVSPRLVIISATVLGVIVTILNIFFR